MSCTARHDAINVLFKPLLDFALGLSYVKNIQLIKLVPQKIQIPSLANLTERKLRKRENKQNDAMLNLFTRDRLGTS